MCKNSKNGVKLPISRKSSAVEKRHGGHGGTGTVGATALEARATCRQRWSDQLVRHVQWSMKAPKSCHITPILRSLHWLRITERIEYKLFSLTYKVLTTTVPNLHTFISSSPLNVFAVLALHPSLLLLGLLHHHL